MDRFSLLDRDWIPVVSLEGERKLVSLREALLNAGQYRRIDTGHPLQTPALYRLLLAILHRALLGPEDAEEGAGWYLQGFPVERVARSRWWRTGSQPRPSCGLALLAQSVRAAVWMGVMVVTH